jgi:hypothetical protein
MLRALINHTTRVTRTISRSRSNGSVFRQRGAPYSTKASDEPANHEQNSEQEVMYDRIEATLNRLGFDRVVCNNMADPAVNSPPCPLPPSYILTRLYMYRNNISSAHRWARQKQVNRAVAARRRSSTRCASLWSRVRV